VKAEQPVNTLHEIVVAVDAKEVAQRARRYAVGGTDIRTQRVLLALDLREAGTEGKGTPMVRIEVPGPVGTRGGCVGLRPVVVVEQDRHAHLRRVGEVHPAHVEAAEIAGTQVVVDDRVDTGHGLEPHVVLVVLRLGAVEGDLRRTVEAVACVEAAAQRRGPDIGIDVGYLGIGLDGTGGTAGHQDVVPRVHGIAQAGTGIEGQPVAVAIGGLFRIESVRDDLHARCRTPLQDRADALLRAVVADVLRTHVGAAVARDRRRHRVVLERRVAGEGVQTLLNDRLLAVRRRDHGAQPLVLGAARKQGEALATALLGQLAVGTRHADDVLVAIRVQRHAGFDVDDAAERAGHLVRAGQLGHGEPRNEFGRHQRQQAISRTAELVEAIAASAGRVEDLAAVVQVHVLAEATHEDAAALAHAALQLHARHAAQRFGDVRIGELADIVGHDRIDDLRGVALEVARFLEALADA
jgi:hypothetical protein